MIASACAITWSGIGGERPGDGVDDRGLALDGVSLARRSEGIIPVLGQLRLMDRLDTRWRAASFTGNSTAVASATLPAQGRSGTA